MKDDWILCRAKDHYVREQDVIAGVCVDCRAKSREDKSLSFTSLNAVFFRSATKPKAKRSSAATY